MSAEEKRRSLAGFGFIIAVSCLWGTALPITAFLLQHMDAVLAMLLRALLAGLVLGAATLFVDGRRGLAVGLPLGRFLALGGWMAGFYVTFTFGIALSDPVAAGCILVTGPPIAAVTAWVLVRAPFDRGFPLALALTMAGGGLIVWGGALAPGREGFSLRGGEFLMVLSNVSWTVYSIRSQQWFGRASQVRRSYVGRLGASLYLVLALPLAPLAGLARMPLFDWAPAAMLALLFVGIVSTGAGNFFWNAGVARVGVPLASLYGNLVPVVGVGVSMAIGHSAHALQIAGAALALAGVVYMQWRKMTA
jgi:drug/metabolite transporter (DMT)-like permease